MKSHFLKHGLTSTLIIVIVLTVFAFSSCEKDDNKIEVNDNYYVKYVIKGTGIYGRFSNWSATTPNGQYTNTGYQVRSWSQTYGPVERGFKCHVHIGNSIGGVPIIEIHVSKNEEPFALKVIEEGKSASYTIDF